jgi:Leucine-rich repeat (LRR) protein
MDPHIWTIIAEYSDFREVVKIRSLCRRIRQLVFHLTIPFRTTKVNDNILKLYLTNLQWLYAGYNPNITDGGIKNLTNLQTLSISSNNSNITDGGIKDLTNLQHLYVYCNPNITDEGIKNLTNLQTLEISTNKNITNEGIKNLTNLQRLDVGNNPNITYEGIKNLTNLKWLNEKQIKKN